MILESRVDRSDSGFAENRARMEALVAELRERHAQVAQGGGERAVERHRSRGKLVRGISTTATRRVQEWSAASASSRARNA
jgi:acetyl-CoA carboxylase carboxyltransferase component